MEMNKAAVSGGSFCPLCHRWGYWQGHIGVWKMASSTWDLPGRREGIRENSKCDEGEVKRVVREISLAGCFLVHNNLYNLI